MVCLGQMMIYLSIPLYLYLPLPFPLPRLIILERLYTLNPYLVWKISENLFPYTWETIFLKFCISPYPVDILNWIYPGMPKIGDWRWRHQNYLNVRPMSRLN